MSYRVLVADDSQTIQKVINITLAKQPYVLVECLSEEALFDQLDKEHADLVCLDFNLSDNFSGPELAERIKAKSPSTQVLFLLGTFDTVDDATMEKCGAADKIVKPFDSNKFISICKQLTHEEPGISHPPQETSSFDNLESQWTVNDTVEKVSPQINIPDPISTPESNFNALDKEMSDWGMSIPGVINEENNDTGPMVDLPPVIETLAEEIDTPQAATPSEADLEYPEIKPRGTQEKNKESKLISLDNFNEFPEEIEFEDNYTPEQTDIGHLEEMIKDEVEADLWKADEFEELKSDVSSALADFEKHPEQVVHSDDDLFPRLDKDDVLPEIKMEETPIVSVSKEEVEALVQKYVKDYLDELFSQKIEKIAWEMIPDLAENLIRSELKKISSKVLEDQD
ncbi:MAG: response regulator [Bacteriovoracaceae bacterium]